MSTQQDIYAAGSKYRSPMLNKENYVPWSSRLLWYAKSRPNGKLIHNSIINGPYVRRMIPEPGDLNHEVSVNETFHVQTYDKLTEKELKQIKADDQAIQTILLGLPKYIYVAVDSCETAQEIWLHVQQMMKGSDIGIQERKAKLFNKQERFTSTDGESIESYYHRFLKLMNDLKKNKYFLEKIARNLNGYNDIQNVKNQTIQNAVQNPRIQNVRNQNGQIVVPGNANQNSNGNGNLIAAHAEGNATGHNGNQIRCYNYRELGYFARNYTVRPRRRDAAYLQTQLLITQKEEAGIQLQAEEFNLMAAAADLDEIEEVNGNCILMANLQQASTSEEKYNELLEPIPEPHQVPQNDNNVISEVSSVEQSGRTVEQHPKNVEETRVLYDSLYNNLAIKVEKVNTVNQFLDDTTPSVAQKFLNEVKSTIVTLQRVVKQRMTLDTYNWPSSAHQELHKIVKDEIFLIVNQVDVIVQNFEIQFLKEAAKFVGDFKSLAKEADESLAKHKALELEIERLLRAVVSQDIMSVVQNNSVDETSNLQTKLELGSESRPPILNKENYVPWSSRLFWYAKSRPNEKLIHNSIINGPYVRRMIPEPGDTNREVPVNETFHVQTDGELTKKELKQIEADDQAI
nr:hypothetical protein [Tanacetum cinerariifolium]